MSKEVIQEIMPTDIQLVEFNITVKAKRKADPEADLVQRVFQLVERKQLLECMNLFKVVYATTNIYSSVQADIQDLRQEFLGLPDHHLESFNTTFSAILAREDVPPSTFACSYLFPKGVDSNTVAKLVATSLKNLVFFNLNERVVRKRINFYYRIERLLEDVQALFKDSKPEYRELCGLIEIAQGVFAKLCTIDCKQYDSSSSDLLVEPEVTAVYPKSLQA